MSSSVKKSSEIKFKIGLDENNIPVDIKWKASDSQQEELIDCKAFMTSIWDPMENNTLSIELWTKDMLTDEMHTFFFQSLLNMARAYNKATGNPFVLGDMKQFCEQLAAKTAEWEDQKK